MSGHFCNIEILALSLWCFIFTPKTECEPLASGGCLTSRLQNIDFHEGFIFLALSTVFSPVIWWPDLWNQGSFFSTSTGCMCSMTRYRVWPSLLRIIFLLFGIESSPNNNPNNKYKFLCIPVQVILIASTEICI